MAPGEMFLAALTVAAQLMFAIGIISLFVKRDNRFIRFLKSDGILLIFIFSLAAMLGSLYYSEIMGYEPCKLCWYQRIAMYPIVLISLIALFKRDQKIVTYTMWLSLVGLLIAANHYLLQITNISVLPCPAIGASPDCSQFFSLKFGYITIPLMALTAFVNILFISLLARSKK